MKWTAQFLASVALLSISAAPSPGLSIAGGLADALSDAVKASRTHPSSTRILRGADFAVSKFDKQMAEAFGKAWMHAESGTSSLEGVVLILRSVDGTYSGRELGTTNEHKKFTFRWQTGTIAIVHTHPNSSDPKPQGEDLAIADRYGVPIFTITSRGMFVYDPGTRKTSKVMKNLEWLDASRFGEASSAKQ